jgi:uncharacterized membrane protein HdeD (DUF308 family)
MNAMRYFHRNRARPRSTWWPAMLWGVAGIVLGSILLSRSTPLPGVEARLHNLGQRIDEWFWHIAA